MTETTCPKTVIITGGAGFIGGHVARALLANGETTVVSIDNYDPFYDPAIKHDHIKKLKTAYSDRFHAITADIRETESLQTKLSPWAAPETIVVHLAAKAGVRPSLADPKSYLSVNVDGTLSVCEWMRANSMHKMVFASSSSVYGSRDTAPFRETDDVSKPISPYAATKLMGEALLHTYSHLYDFRIVALRFFTVYGAYQRPDLAIHKFAKLMKTGQPIPVFGDGSARRDFSYIDDIVAGILGAITYEQSPYEIINLGESETTTVSELIALLEKALNIKATIDWQDAQPGDVPLTCADVSKARKLLGYNPSTPIHVGIEKFADWFLSNETLTHAL